MRYVMSRYAQQVETDAYRVYVTDVLKVITSNIVNGFGGAEINERYYDMIHRHVETRSSDEIISGIKGKLKEAMEE